MSKRKFPPIPNSANSRKKLKKIKGLLDVLRKKIPNLNNTIRNKLGIQNRTRVRQLIQFLNTLDNEFTKDNFQYLYVLINEIELSPLQYQWVDTLDNRIDAVVQIKRDTRIVHATSQVLLDCMYQRDPCVVKVMEKGVDKVDLFIETLINIFMSAVTENKVNQFISSPNVITMGTLDNFSISPGNRISFTKKMNRKNSSNQLILVQEKLNGVTFKKLWNDEKLLIQALKQLCRGLKILQNDYSFAHKDFHGENVMYNTDDERVYIIDFGYSCFSIPDTPGSIQSLEGGYGINQLDNDYKEHIPCMNKSADLCTLLLSLIYFGAEYEWLEKIGEDICARYTSEYKKFSDGWQYMNGKINSQKGERWNWTSPIFHFWYIYEMFEIDVGFGPDQLLKLLEEKFPSSTDSTQITYPKLKF